jgi:hypothetical protein
MCHPVSGVVDRTDAWGGASGPSRPDPRPGGLGESRYGGEVNDVAAVVFLVVVALLVALEFGGSLVRRSWRRRAAAVDRPQTASPQPSDTSPAGFAMVKVDDDGEREEALLAGALLAGDLPAAWYRQRMAVLAAQDALRRPMFAPPNGDI